MAKASKPSKKKKVAPKKKVIKKAVPKKKTAKKAVAVKSKALSRGGSTRSLIKCKCVEREGVFICMVRQPNGKFKESPIHSSFDTKEKCEQNCCQ
jgi:hypothetical protein